MSKSDEHMDAWRRTRVIKGAGPGTECADAEIARLRAEVERLRLTDAEREAIEAGALAVDALEEEMDGFSSNASRTLRALLARLGSDA